MFLDDWPLQITCGLNLDPYIADLQSISPYAFKIFVGKTYMQYFNYSDSKIHTLKILKT